MDSQNEKNTEFIVAKTANINFVNCIDLTCNTMVNDSLFVNDFSAVKTLTSDLKATNAKIRILDAENANINGLVLDNLYQENKQFLIVDDNGNVTTSSITISSDNNGTLSGDVTVDKIIVNSSIDLSNMFKNDANAFLVMDNNGLVVASQIGPIVDILTLNVSEVNLPTLIDSHKKFLVLDNNGTVTTSAITISNENVELPSDASFDQVITSDLFISLDKSNDNQFLTVDSNNKVVLSNISYTPDAQTIIDLLEYQSLTLDTVTLANVSADHINTTDFVTSDLFIGLDKSNDNQFLTIDSNNKVVLSNISYTPDAQTIIDLLEYQDLTLDTVTLANGSADHINTTDLVTGTLTTSDLTFNNLYQENKQFLIVESDGTITTSSIDISEFDLPSNVTFNEIVTSDIYLVIDKSGDNQFLTLNSDNKIVLSEYNFDISAQTILDLLSGESPNVYTLTAQNISTDGIDTYNLILNNMYEENKQFLIVNEDGTVGTSSVTISNSVSIDSQIVVSAISDQDVTLNNLEVQELIIPTLSNNVGNYLTVTSGGIISAATIDSNNNTLNVINFDTFANTNYLQTNTNMTNGADTSNWGLINGTVTSVNTSSLNTYADNASLNDYFDISIHNRLDYLESYSMARASTACLVILTAKQDVTAKLDFENTYYLNNTSFVSGTDFYVDYLTVNPSDNESDSSATYTQLQSFQYSLTDFTDSINAYLYTPGASNGSNNTYFSNTYNSVTNIKRSPPMFYQKGAVIKLSSYYNSNSSVNFSYTWKSMNIKGKIFL